ncbi:putative tetraspanin [Lyophyllum shimeji]|uniref:Tetraspanin n=1 Tax=Lyophyllum shimeji TaxID=47721 RepID=A0A9P3UI98_LYOSH|nr:putative tetraspanin [Lyophyllum shimeji]
MPSRKLMGVWVALDFLLLAAGAVTLALALAWKAEHANTLLNLVLTPNYLTAGMVLGIALLVTFAISIGAIVQKNHVTIGLVVLNYTLLVDAIGIVVIGTFIWFFTLQERNNFHVRWQDASRDTRIKLQDQLKCCGYFNGTDLAEIGGGFCQSQEFVAALNTSVLTNFCVQPITNYADMTLNNVFTYVYYLSLPHSCPEQHLLELYMATWLLFCVFCSRRFVLSRRGKKMNDSGKSTQSAEDADSSEKPPHLSQLPIFTLSNSLYPFFTFLLLSH